MKEHFQPGLHSTFEIFDSQLMKAGINAGFSLFLLWADHDVCVHDVHDVHINDGHDTHVRVHDVHDAHFASSLFELRDGRRDGRDLICLTFTQSTQTRKTLTHS